MNTNYHPSATKYYYMRNPRCTISGPAMITSDTQTYSVNNLPSGCTVTWAISDSYYNQNCLQQNYPDANKCTVSLASSHNLLRGTLSATISYSGISFLTITKEISASLWFIGTYYNGFHTRNIVLPVPLYTNVGGFVEIDSPNMISAVVGFSGITPSSYQFENSKGIIRIQCPASTSGTMILKILTKEKKEFSLQIVISSNTNLYVAHNDSQLDVEIVREVTTDNKIGASVEIFDANRGVKVFSSETNAQKMSVNTSNWKKGLYVVRATVDGKMLTEKIRIK